MLIKIGTKTVDVRPACSTGVIPSRVTSRGRAARQHRAPFTVRLDRELVRAVSHHAERDRFPFDADERERIVD